MANGIALEVMDANHVWQEITDDLKMIDALDIGLSGQRAFEPKQGRMNFRLENSDKAYSDTDVIDVNRRVRLRVNSDTLGKCLRVIHTGLVGTSGETSSITTHYTDFYLNGGPGGTDGNRYYVAQRIYVDVPGTLSQIRSDAIAADTTYLQWQIRADSSNYPGLILQEGEFTEFGASFYGLVEGGVYLSVGYYWVVLFEDSTAAVPSPVRTIDLATSDTYANGRVMFSTTNGNVWFSKSNYYDADIRIITKSSSGSAHFYQTVTQAVAAADVWTLTWEARAQFSNQRNGGVAQIVTNVDTGTKEYYNYTNKWASYSHSFTATNIGTSIEARFFASYDGSGSNADPIEYRNIQLKKGAGSNILTNGNFATGSTSPWAVSATDGTEGYSDTANRDHDVNLEYPENNGGTVTITGSGANSAIGGTGAAQTWAAQEIDPVDGVLSQIQITWGANTGTPSGTVTWAIVANLAAATTPASYLATGTLTPTASSTDTINVVDGPTITTTVFLIVKPTSNQSGGNNWNWQRSTSSVYAGGTARTSADSGVNWTTLATSDHQCVMTTTPNAVNNKLAQAFKVYGGLISSAELYLKKVGSPTGTMTLRIETDDDDYPSGTLAHANATATKTEASLTTSLAMETFTFAGNVSLDAGVPYWLVLDTDRSYSLTNYVAWGADNGGSSVYRDGFYNKNIDGTWSVTLAFNQDRDFIFKLNMTVNNTLAVIDDYQIKFNGVIKDIDVDGGLYGTLETKVSCVDKVYNLKKQNVPLQLQIDQSPYQVNQSLWGLFPSYQLDSVLIGTSQVETDTQIYNRVFDGYNQNQIDVFTAMSDNAKSEYGRFWVDGDGTFRFSDRGFMVRAQHTDPVLSISPGDSVKFSKKRSLDVVTNKSVIKLSPRTTDIAVSQVGSVPVVGYGLELANGGSKSVTVPFKDAYGNSIGAESVITPVKGTDYQIWYNAVNISSTNTGVTLTTEVSASQVILTFTNNSGHWVRIRNIVVRALAVTRYDPIEVEYDQSGNNPPVTTTRDLPFSNDQLLAESMAAYFVEQYSTPFWEVQNVHIENARTIDSVDLLLVDACDDTIELSDTQADLTDALHVVIGYTAVLDPTIYGWVKSIDFITESVDKRPYILLDDTVLLDDSHYFHV